jgi:hypothetical protein
MIWPTILSCGTFKIPVLIIEVFLEKDVGYDSNESVYKSFVQDLRFKIHEKRSIIIYRQWNVKDSYVHHNIEIKKKEFLDIIKGEILVEFHVYTLDYRRLPQEMFFIEMVMYENKEPTHTQFKKRPKFHVKNTKNKYISFYKRTKP